MKDLWQPPGSTEGACSTDLPHSTMMGSTVFVRACAQFAPADSKSYLVAAFNVDGADAEWADPGNWEIEVWRPTGESLVVFRPEHRAPVVDRCTGSICTRWSVERLPMPVEWQPGRWRIRYTNSKVTSAVSDMSIYLHSGAR
jgi:hypothetical protein